MIRNMKVAVIGSRDFDDFDLMVETLKEIDISEIVSGGARGADRMAERYSKEYLKRDPKVFYADWKNNPDYAGFERNKDIVDYADVVVAFWDGESPGTKDAITYAKRKRKPVKLVFYSIDNPMGI